MKDVQDNAALSVLRVVARALVVEPQMSKFILERARLQVEGLNVALGLEAIEALRDAFEKSSPRTRKDLSAVAAELLSDERPRLGARISSKALAGQALLSALHELPAVAAG